MTRSFALALLAAALLAAGSAEAGSQKNRALPVAIVSVPEGGLRMDALGTPIRGIVDLSEGLPPGATDSDNFEIPLGQLLILDQIGALATFDQDLPAGSRYSLFLTGEGVQMPLGFGEAIGNQIHVALPLAIVLRGNFRLAILGDFGSADLQFVRYSFTGRLVPEP